MKKILSVQNLESLKNIIQSELEKRGITAKIETMQEFETPPNFHDNKIRMMTGDYQSNPLISKKNKIYSGLTLVIRKKGRKDFYNTKCVGLICVRHACVDLEGHVKTDSLFDLSFSVVGKDEEIVKSEITWNSTLEKTQSVISLAR